MRVRRTIAGFSSIALAQSQSTARLGSLGERVIAKRVLSLSVQRWRRGLGWKQISAQSRGLKLYVPSQAQLGPPRYETSALAYTCVRRQNRERRHKPCSPAVSSFIMITRWADGFGPFSPRRCGSGSGTS